MSNGITVHLGGQLGVLFGERWEGLYVSSPAEALHAIDINLKGGLRRYLGENRQSEYHFCVDHPAEETCLGKDELVARTGKGDIYVLPSITGRNSGWAKIIAGVILIIVGAIFYAYGGQALIGLGASLILGGITQLLTGVPQQNQQLQSANFGFQGNATAATQGGCVPIFYGRYLITPVPICISFVATDINYAQNGIVGGTSFGSGPVGNVNTTPAPGGGVGYDPGDPSYPFVPGGPPLPNNGQGTEF